MTDRAIAIAPSVRSLRLAAGRLGAGVLSRVGKDPSVTRTKCAVAESRAYLRVCLQPCAVVTSELSSKSRHHLATVTVAIDGRQKTPRSHYEMPAIARQVFTLP